jgi:putative ABC transport system substrate-binding protein
MQRREFITLLGTAAVAWPLAARAQPRTAMPVVGYLYLGVPEASGASAVASFRKGLSETGFVEGRNVAIEYRWAGNDPTRLPELAADLVRRRVSIIVAPGSTLAALAANEATSNIPIVFGIGSDPVQIGLVASLNRPGGNVTGFANMAVEVAAKQFGLLHELLPKAARFAHLVNSTSANTPSRVMDVQTAAASLGQHIELVTASNSSEIDAAFANAIQKRADAILVAPNPLFGNRQVQLITLAMYHRIPAIYGAREIVAGGGLMSYGSSNADMIRNVGIYTARILKGERPADLPVQLATKFKFVLNLHTARTLRIEVPPTLLAIADEVIE